MLIILEKIFNLLNDESIRYIHWKSNEHLEASMNGDTDLDIMVHEDDQKRFVKIITDNGFVLFQSVGKQSYITISDYLLLDPESKKIVHIHLHNSLVIGRKFFKEYLIPVEDIFFLKSKYDCNYPVKIMDSSQELIVLWLRYALKTSLVKYALKGCKISKDYVRESEWLEQKSDYNTLYPSLEEFKFKNTDRLNNAFIDFFYKNKNIISTMKLLYRIRKILKKYKTSNLTGLKYINVRLVMIINFILQKKLNIPIPYRRINPSGGKIIAIVGPDGSGKSTIIASLKKGLSTKIDIYCEYLGSGDGRSSLIRFPLHATNKIMKKLRASSRHEYHDNNEFLNHKKLNMPRVIWAVALAIEKDGKIKKIWKAKAKGMTIICDRYPQSKFMGINDGPLMSSWNNSKSVIKRKIASWEFEIYQQANIFKPDLLVKLIVDPEIAIERKPDENIENIRLKSEIIKTINIPSKKCVSINASKSLERVLYEVYTEVAKIF